MEHRSEKRTLQIRLVTTNDIALVLRAVASILQLAGGFELVEDLAGMLLGLLGGVGVVEVCLRRIRCLGQCMDR